MLTINIIWFNIANLKTVHQFRRLQIAFQKSFQIILFKVYTKTIKNTNTMTKNTGEFWDT